MRRDRLKKKNYKRNDRRADRKSHHIKELNHFECVPWLCDLIWNFVVEPFEMWTLVLALFDAAIAFV